MSDEYDNVARGKLKLKTDSGKISKKHKKSKKNNKDERGIMENPSREKDCNSYTYEERIPKPQERQLTKAEISFKKMQTKMVSRMIFKCKFAFKFRCCFDCTKNLSTFHLFYLQQEKRVMEKAGMTHKQRVEKFNEHLDNLTEHFDIPKVSWTK